MGDGKRVLRDDALRGEHILVTGGGSGLGKVFATAFSALGADVTICGRRGPVVAAAAAEIAAATGGRVQAMTCDIADTSSVEMMLAEIWARAPLTGLVNNAAGNFISRTEDLSMRGFDAIANIVFRGTFNITLDVGKRWIEAGRKGNVLSILATWVWNGSPFTVPSAMSKTAVHAMTQSLAVEWGRYGIRLNAIAPGPFPTEGAWKRLWPDDAGDAAEAARGNPMNRVGEMSEIANLAAFLMAPGTDYLTGQTIAIDGGAYLATGANFSALSAWTDEQWTEARRAIRQANEQDRALRGAPGAGAPSAPAA